MGGYVTSTNAVPCATATARFGDGVSRSIIGPTNTTACRASCAQVCECDDGYFLHPTTGQCEVCSSKAGCDMCRKAADACTRCAAGYRACSRSATVTLRDGLPACALPYHGLDPTAQHLLIGDDLVDCEVDPDTVDLGLISLGSSSCAQNNNDPRISDCWYDYLAR